jgi:uncharacterized membrane protein YbhN (UPF0104 family)
MKSGTIKKLLWAFFLSVSFMAILLYGVDWTHFPSIAEKIKINTLIAAFGALLLANIIRSWRFYTLDHFANKKYTSWLIINKVYNYLTATLPGGVGEAATAYLIKRHSFFNMISAFRLLLLSRVMDLTGISTLLLFSVVQLEQIGKYNEMILWFSGILLLVSFAAVIPTTERYFLDLVRRLPGRNLLMQRVRERMKELSEISEEHRGRKTLGITLIQSVLIMAVTAVSLHFILLSVEAGVTILQSFYCFTVYAVLQMIPLQGIAGVGTQPARWVVALNLAGYKTNDVVALGIVLHGTMYIFISIMGILALLIWLVARKVSTI